MTYRRAEASITSSADGRTYRAVFATEQVARDNHRILGWALDNYRRNAVVQWAHDTSQPPIAKASGLVARGGNLSGEFTFVPEGTCELADTIAALVRSGYINATSVSWNPIEWKYCTDRNRPGGIDFSLADLLEISLVPLPSDPDALIEARTRGINLDPLATWAGQALDERRNPIPRAELETFYRAATGG